MHFYNLRIKNSSSVNHAASGKFCGNEEPDIIVSRGRILEIYTVDLSQNNVFSLLAMDFNAMIRSLAPIRGVKKDFIAITSDAGKIVILEFVLEGRYFKTALEHRFEYEIKVSLGLTPGEFLAVHQKSSAIAIGALEGGIMFYNDPVESSDEFYSPIKMNKPRYVFYDLVDVCSDSEHPVFASLEVQYDKTKGNKNAFQDTESSQLETSKQFKSTSLFQQKLSADGKSSFSSLSRDLEKILQETDKTVDKTPPMVLVFYEWNIQSKSVDMSVHKLKCHATKLISVPDGNCHKGGIIICFCNEIQFVEIGTFEKAHCFIPQRCNVAFNNEKGMLISCGATYKKGDELLILLQSEDGDLFSVEILKDNEELSIQMKYVDTVPVASALCIIEGEYLFLGADFGDHFLYKIKSLASNDEYTIFENIQLFTARKVENLEIIKQLEGLVPVINCIAPACSTARYSASKSPVYQQMDYSNNLLQIYFACGLGPSSSLRTLKHGVQVEELLSLGNFFEGMYPKDLWAFRQETEDGGFKTLIVVSCPSVQTENVTTVLSVDKEVNEVYDSGFQLSQPTLNCVQVGNDSFVQILPDKVVYVCQKEAEELPITCFCNDKLEEASILKSAAYNNQTAVALVCKEIVLIKSIDGSIDSRRIAALQSDVVSMEFIPCETESEYLVVCFNDSIHIYFVESEDFCLISIAERKFDRVPSSLVCNKMDENGIIFFMNIGFEDGSFMRAYLNENNEIESSFSLKLDSNGIELVKLNEDTILAISSQAWISFDCKTKFNLVPLLYSNLVCAASCAPTNLHPEANLIAVSNGKLMLLCVKNFVSLFTENFKKLELTPRQSVWNFKNGNLIMSVNDYRPPSYKDGDVTPQMAMELTSGTSKFEAPNPKAEYLNQMVRNRPPSKYDCELSILDPINQELVFKETFPENHVIMRLCLVEFGSKPTELHLLASVKKCIQLYPEENFEYYIYTYKVSDDGKTFKLIDKTDMMNFPSAICSCKDYVLIGVQNKLWLCDFDQKIVFMYCVEMPCKISNVYARGSFYVVLCEYQNVIYGFWNEEEKMLVNIHEDRYLGRISTLCFIDDDIMVAADMAGYLNVVLLPEVPFSTEEKLYESSASSQLVQEKYISINRFRITPDSHVLVKHYLGEIVTSLQKTSFVINGPEVILYASLSGTVGVFVPFLNKTADMIFEPLQYLLKIKSFFHNKGSSEWMEEGENIYSLFKDQQSIKVIDGNVCDMFHTLFENEQKEIAQLLEKEPFEINEKLAEMKTKIYFELLIQTETDDD